MVKTPNTAQMPPMNFPNPDMGVEEPKPKSKLYKLETKQYFGLV